MFPHRKHPYFFCSFLHGKHTEKHTQAGGMFFSNPTGTALTHAFPLLHTRGKFTPWGVSATPGAGNGG